MEEKVFSKWFFICAMIFLILIILATILTYVLEGNLDSEGVFLSVCIMIVMLLASIINDNR